jgi:hypothetical protein
MSFHINSDKEKIRGVNPKLIGDNEATIRIGTGSNETEVFRTQLDPQSGLPRVGINRTGKRVNEITVTAGGSGYTTTPLVEIDPPPAGGRQAQATAFIFAGEVTSIAVNDSGDGYTSAPLITITGGNGAGATAVSLLDTVDYELDINGAIRTSTSIISDTARVLNLDIDNFVTPDLNLRAPNLKTYLNATGTPWATLPQKDILDVGDYRYFGQNVYEVIEGGETSGTFYPTHKDGTAYNGEVLLKHIGFRVVDQNAPYYQETGDAGIYPRSITPRLGDRSDSIATTEYVLNLATNDVGGRIYVSEQIGSNLNDGRSAVAPVRDIKRAAQIAWSTPGVKETIIVAGGNYEENNPISLPPDCSVVGDNLRLVIIRPKNPGKDIFKFGDKNYVTGVTYRDSVDSQGFSQDTWRYAMVFDDKQRIVVDNEVNGDFGVDFPIGHEIIGPDEFRLSFNTNTGGAALTPNLDIVSQIQGARARSVAVRFDSLTGNDAYSSGTIDIRIVSGGFAASEGFRYYTGATQGSLININPTETAGPGFLRFTTDPSTLLAEGSFVYLDDTNDAEFTAGFYEVTGIITANAPAYWDVRFGTVLNAPNWTTEGAPVSVDIYSASVTSAQFNSSGFESIRAEGEVVSVDYDTTSFIPIYKLDFSLQGDPSIATGGFQSDLFGDAEDLGGIIVYTNQLVFADNIHDFKEGQEIFIEGMPTSPDLTFLNGKQRIYKVLEDADGRSRRFVIPKKSTITTKDFFPGDAAKVYSYSKSITLSLRNSPNTFPLATPVQRRYQDACQLIRNNRDFIADEVVRTINDQFKKEYYSVYNISGNSFDIYLGVNTIGGVHTYVSGGTVSFGGGTVNVTNFVWDNVVTGVATITTDSPVGASEDDTVRLADILVECDNGQKIYPSFSIPVDDDQCREDVVHFLNALVRDLEFGSNHNIVEAAEKYIVGAQIGYVENEIIQTVRAIEYARQLAIYAMCNWRTGNRTTSDPIYTPVYSSLPRYFDDTVITATAGSPACDDVRSAIDTLSYLWVDVIANNASGTYLDAAYLIARNRDLIADQAYLDTLVQYPSLGLNNVDERKCRRDINYILRGLIRDLVLGGNTGIVTAAESYYSGAALTGIPAGELPATRYAFGRVAVHAISAMRNWVDGSGAAVSTSSPIPQFTDNTILADPSGNPLCANVEASISTSMDLLDGILEYADNPLSPTAVSPGATTKTSGTLFDTSSIKTYPDSYIYDANGTRMAVRANYDDYPIIEASPYTQNASVISFLGGSGAEIDGKKVKQPNCPFPGLNQAVGDDPPTAIYPNQGKSMVAAAFTIVSQGGTGYMIKNDGYVQLVSVFCVFCSDGVVAESGGYASITNSATNFGQYALRANGFREEPYVFDIGTIDQVTQTAAGRTVLRVIGLGRPPLEHYIVKIPGYTNLAGNLEYFIDDVGVTSITAPFNSFITVANGDGNDPLELVRDSDGTVITGLTALQQELTPAGSANAEIRLHRPSIVNSSSHTWEYAGAGTTYNALPENGGTKREEFEQVDGPDQNYGRVYVSGTDELGDFKVGTFAKIENRTGAITFTGTVTISEVEFLKLKGGTTVVTGFSNDATLGGSNSSESKLPTQLAVYSYITNNLGAYINKPYSTNAVPRALVELTDSGKISPDQIPALRPFSVYTVEDEAERLALEGALAGDIAIQSDTNASFILNNDLDSLFLAFAVDGSLQFTIGDLYTGSGTGGSIQATEYREGVVYQLNLTNAGSGYSTAPNVQIQSPGGTGVTATAECTIANGQVVTITITENGGYYGGKDYTSVPTVVIDSPPGAGTQATADALIESRLYGDIVNNIKVEDTDSITDDTSTSVNLTRVLNTSASDSGNWVSLNAQAISVGSLSGPGLISTTLLGSQAANSKSFLRGDQSYAPAVQTVKGVETRYFVRLTAAAPSGSSQLVFVDADILDDIVIGHDVSESIAGVPADTSVIGFATSGGLTTVALNNPLTANIAAGTYIEFFRGKSPIKIDSIDTKGDFIADIIIANPGSGYTAGTYRNLLLTGAGATNGSADLRADITVNSSGEISNVTITNGGNGFDPYVSSTENGDFSITIPAAIGPGSGAVLEAKSTTTKRSFGFLGLDVSRVTDSTISADLYGTVGVAKFKKSQFEIGADGAVTLKDQTNTINSGLDADLLDGLQGTDYLDGFYFVDGSITPDKLQQGVEYDISVKNSSGSSNKLNTITTNNASNPDPFETTQGVGARTIFNTADGLAQAYPSTVTSNVNADKHLVLTIRTAGSSSTVDGGGVRQLAFGNDDNMYLRGSGDSLTQWGAWQKVWTSLNDGPGNAVTGDGPDADRLDNRQGSWYQQAWNLFGVDPKTSEQTKLWDINLPRYISSTKFRDKIEIQSTSGNAVAYSIFVRRALDISPTGIFRAGQNVNVYDIGKNNIGNFTISAPIQHVDNNDVTENYTILQGTLSSGGSLVNAYFIGTAGNEEEFDTYSILDSNTFQLAELGNASGNGYLSLGRKDGNASTPYIYFNSASAASNYDVALIASGGDANDGKGSLDVKVADENQLTVNANIVWNAGNVAFNSTNVVSTSSLKSAVVRDTSGNFSAGTITASLTGAASLNVLKAGDTMTGTLTFTGAGSGINIQNGSISVGQNATIDGSLTVDGTTLFVDNTNNKVTVGSTTSGPSRLNVSDSNGSTAYVANLALAAQTSQYKFTVWNSSNGGESGMVLRHGTTAGEPSEWGLSVLRSAANVGDLIIRTKTGTSSNAERLKISSAGDVTPGATDAQHMGTASRRWSAVYSNYTETKTSIRIGDAGSNSGADLQFKGATSGAGGGRSWRIGNALNSGADVFEISASNSLGGTDWRTALSPTPGQPVMAFDGNANAVAINTTAFSGVDNSDPQSPVNRNYILNVGGDMNINGQLFQNNEEFVTSRWTESTNDSGANIYRTSKVGIGNVPAPAYQLDVAGNVNMTGVLYVGGVAQWFDTFGIIKSSATNIQENVTIPTGKSGASVGEIQIDDGFTVEIQSGGSWSIN